MSLNNNNNNPICKAPECQKTSVAYNVLGIPDERTVYTLVKCDVINSMLPVICLLLCLDEDMKFV